MAPLTHVWAVRDPGPESELVDILFELDLGGKFLDYVVGGAVIRDSRDPVASIRANWEEEHTTLYLDRGEAERDALARLAKGCAECERLAGKEAFHANAARALPVVGGSPGVQAKRTRYQRWAKEARSDLEAHRATHREGQ